MSGGSPPVGGGPGDEQMRDDQSGMDEPWGRDGRLKVTRSGGFVSRLRSGDIWSIRVVKPVVEVI